MEKNKLIIIEGFDRTGKDTLIKGVLKKYPEVYHYVQPTSESVGISYRDTKAFEKYLEGHYTELINDLIKLNHKVVITSRLYVSDATYSSLFNRKYQFGELAEKYKLSDYYDIHSFCILWNNYGEYLKRVEASNSIIEYNEEEFKKLSKLFSKFTLENNGHILTINHNTLEWFILKQLENIYFN